MQALPEGASLNSTAAQAAAPRPRPTELRNPPPTQRIQSGISSLLGGTPKHTLEKKRLPETAPGQRKKLEETHPWPLPPSIRP